MLYVTTRDDLTTYTSEQAIGERRAPDGGFYIPYKIPKLSYEELRFLRSMSPCDRVRSIARRFIRLPDKLLDAYTELGHLCPMGDRVTLCEIFPKGCGSFREYVSQLAERLCFSDHTSPLWLAISIRIGAVASAVVEMMVESEHLDIVMLSGDLFGPMTAYLAREMGLPIGDILCCCNENGFFWELLHHGMSRTDQLAVRSAIPEADTAVPEGLECLIALCCGREEVVRYLEAVRSGRPYVPGEEPLACLRSAFRATVVTDHGMIRGAHRSRIVPVKADTALVLAGLLDHWALNGPRRHALVIAE